MARTPFYQIAGTTVTPVLTAGAGVDTFVVATATNITGTTLGTVYVDFTDASDSDTAKVLLDTTEVAAGDAVDVRSRAILLNDGDVLRVRGSAASTISLDGFTVEIS